MDKIKFDQRNTQSSHQSPNLLEEKFKIISERLIQNKGFLFGDKITRADLSLFSVLVQYFEGPLINENLKNYFMKEWERKLNKNNFNYFDGKGKGKVEEEKDEEEDLNEIIEVKEEKKESSSNKFEDDYVNWEIQILFEFVEKIKKHLGFGNNEKWKGIQVKPWILNYENEINLSEKYNGNIMIKSRPVHE